MKETMVEKYAYLLLIVIAVAIILQFFSQKNIEDETSAVILNLHKGNITYTLENPGKTDVNVTIYDKNNAITGSVVLKSRHSKDIGGDNFTAIGEEYE